MVDNSNTNKNAARRVKKLTLLRLTPVEEESVRSMYKLLDHKSVGSIPNYLARNLMRELGFEVNMLACFSTEVTLNEILSLLDQLMPDPDPQKFLEGSLSSFIGMVCRKHHAGDSEESSAYNNQLVLKPTDISDFMESLGRPAPSAVELGLLLNSMLDYDDCAEVPVLKADSFVKEVIHFAKKNNALKDIR